MRYALLLPGLLMLAACADGLGSPPPPDAFVAPDDCLDPEKRLHPDWLQLCAELDED